jgi:hypothetical protein
MVDCTPPSPGPSRAREGGSHPEALGGQVGTVTLKRPEALGGSVGTVTLKRSVARWAQ